MGHGTKEVPPPVYPGPGDIVPSAPAAGAPGLAAAPRGAVPSPSSPARPAAAPPGLRATTGTWVQPVDTTSWRYWWDLNKEPYLRLRDALDTGGVLTGSDDFFLGFGARRVLEAGARVDDAAFRTTLLPAYERALKDERDGRLLASGLLGLARAGAGREETAACAAAILPFLDDGRIEVAEAATVALGILGEPSTVPVLFDLLSCDTAGLRRDHRLGFGEHVSSRQRAFAAHALGMLGARADGYWRTRIVNFLATAILDESHRVRSYEVQAACAIAMGLVPLPVRAEEPDFSQPRVGLISRQEQVRWLLGMLDEPALDERVRAQAPIALARLMQVLPARFPLREVAAERMVHLLGARSGARNAVRQSCALALGWVGDADGDVTDASLREALATAAAEASDQATRRFAWIALARASGRAGQGEGEPLAGLSATRELLGRELAGGSTPMRPWAALAIGVLERALIDSGRPPSGDMQRALRTALREARGLEEVGACAIGLGLTRDPASAPLLRSGLARVGDAETRADLALALGMIDATDAREELRDACRGSRARVELLGTAAVALALLGDKGVDEYLLELLDDAGSLASQEPLLDALGRVGLSETVAPLVAVAERSDLTAGARAAALAALGSIAELDPLPWSARLSVGCNYLTEVQTLVSFPRGAGVLDMR